MNLTMDTTMSDSQASQFMKDKFPPQGRSAQSSVQSVQSDLKKAQQDFLSSLITRNNTENEDTGILAVLGTLDKDYPIKAMTAHKDIKRPQLVATLGFMNRLSFDTA